MKDYQCITILSWMFMIYAELCETKGEDGWAAFYRVFATIGFISSLILL